MFGMTCSAVVGETDTLPQPAFPLKEEAIILALEKARLPGKISESETVSLVEGQIEYVVRHPTETYSDEISLEEARAKPESRVIVATVSSAMLDGERVIFTSFIPKGAPEQFAWEDWKQQIVFTTLLYGSFEDEEDVYRTFSDKVFPKGEVSFEWDAQLPGGYCVTRYQSHMYYDEYGVEKHSNLAILSVSIYESQALYQKLRGSK